ILPTEFAPDADRVARFNREAQVPSLDHPNIGAIYGFEDSAGVHALVLQLVEGPILADRIAQGAIPVDEALPIAHQIAEALEAARADEVAMPLTIGSRLGPYLVVAALGAGGMGEVYRARGTKLNRDVLIASAAVCVADGLVASPDLFVPA